jgi:hypothetical protein
VTRSLRALLLTAGALAAALPAGCSRERIAECDALLATLEQVSECDRLEPGQRLQVEQAVRSMKESMDRLEDVGPGRVPATLLDETKRTCAKQDAQLRQLYANVTPACLR